MQTQQEITAFLKTCSIVCLSAARMSRLSINSGLRTHSTPWMPPSLTYALLPSLGQNSGLPRGRLNYTTFRKNTAKVTTWGISVRFPLKLLADSNEFLLNRSNQ